MKKDSDKSKKRLEDKTTPQLEDILWTHCKRITRKRFKDCYTCSQKNLEGANAHTGHYFPKGALGAILKYDLRVLRLQCMRCNYYMGGMGGVFRENMKKEIGVEAEQNLYNECTASKGFPIKAKDHYIKLIRSYEQIID